MHCASLTVVVHVASAHFTGEMSIDFEKGTTACLKKKMMQVEMRCFNLLTFNICHKFLNNL